MRRPCNLVNFCFTQIKSLSLQPNQFKMQNKNYFWSFVMVVIATIFWGFSFVWSKQLLEVMNSISIIFFRMIIASIALYTIGRITGLFKRVERKDLGRFFIISLIQPFLYFLFELSSIKYNSPTLTALIIAQIPLFIGLINLIFNKKKLSVNVTSGIVISLIGVAMVIAGGGDASLIATPFGIFLSICAMACAVTYNFQVAKVVKKYNPLTITTYIHGISLLYFLPLFFIFEWKSISQLTFTTPIIASIFALGVLCSAIAFLFYIYGVKDLGIVTSSMINNLSPAITAIGIFLIFGEQLSTIQITGIAITIIGLTVGVLKSK